MRKKLLFLAFLITFSPAISQTIYKSINSVKLGKERKLKIQLPRNYDSNTEKTYPIIIALDGDYLFEPIAGNVDYYSYWNEIPEAIVVGVLQDGQREADCFYDPQRFLPAETGAAFFEFLGMELLPFLDQNYRTAKFVVVAGHDLSANFIDYYLFKPDPLFHAYINLSPDLAPEMAERLTGALGSLKSKKWFYLATSSEDIPALRKPILVLDKQLRLIENEKLHYTFEDFDDANHYTMIGQAIPRALESIFASYGPISVKEYDTQIVISETSPYDYLVVKYETIEEYFGLKTQIRINDFLAIGKALEFHQNWNDMEKLGELARRNYPNSMLGTYYLARSYEAGGNPKKAMRMYQNAYGQEEVAFLTVDFMLEKAELIKQDFGY